MTLSNLEKLRYNRKLLNINLKSDPKDILTMVSLLDNMIVSIINFLGMFKK